MLRGVKNYASVNIVVVAGHRKKSTRDFTCPQARKAQNIPEAPTNTKKPGN